MKQAVEARAKSEEDAVVYRITKAGGKGYPFWDSECTGCGHREAIAHPDWKYCPMCGKPVRKHET